MLQLDLHPNEIRKREGVRLSLIQTSAIDESIDRSRAVLPIAVGLPF